MNLRRPESLVSFPSFHFINADVQEIPKQIKVPQPYACCIVKIFIHQILLQMLSCEHSKAFISHLHEIKRARLKPLFMINS